MPFSYSESKWSLIDLHPDLVAFTRTPRYSSTETFEDRGECPLFLGFDCAIVVWMRPRTQEQQAELFKTVGFDPTTAKDVRHVLCADPRQQGLSWFQPA